MKEDFKSFLNSKNCFKLILGANNHDIDAIRHIVKIYHNAGCKFFDISSDAEIFDVVCRQTNNTAFICISIGVEDDPHFYKCKIDKSRCIKCEKCIGVCPQNAINNEYDIIENKCIGCKKCVDICYSDAIDTYKKQKKWDFELLKNADCVEFHISTKNKYEIFSKWETLIKNYKGIISICIGRKYFSGQEMIGILGDLIKSCNNYIIIQADENPMSGGKDDYHSSLQAIACADVIINTYRDIPVFISGGMNSHSAKLAKMFDVDVTGVSVGTYARKLIQSVSSEIEQVKLAKKLIESLKL